MLTELEQDALVEILNTNLGKAASLLSEMVSQRVLLSVPEISLRMGGEFHLNDYQDHSKAMRTSVLCSMRFGKQFSGYIYLILPAERVRDLVLACTDGEMPAYGDFDKLTTEDLDVIREISNIIFNSMIGEFGDLLSVRIQYDLPQTEMISVDGDDEGILPNDLHFLTTNASFMLAKSQLRGLIFIALSVDSEKMLLNKIDDLLVDIHG